MVAGHALTYTHPAHHTPHPKSQKKGGSIHGGASAEQHRVEWTACKAAATSRTCDPFLSVSYSCHLTQHSEKCSLGMHIPAPSWQLPLTFVVASKQVLQHRRPSRPVVIWQRGVELVQQLAALDAVIYQLRGV